MSLEEITKIIMERADVPPDVKEDIQKIIAERVLADGLLKVSENKYQNKYQRLFETAKDGILILDPENGMIEDVNPFLVDLLGYSTEEFRKKTIWDIGFFSDILSNQIKFEELQEKKYVRYDNLPLETKDGRHINVEFVSNIYKVDGHDVIQCNIRDITQRRMAEDALAYKIAYKNMLLEAQLETSLDGILAVDEHGHTILFNKRFGELWNIPHNVLETKDDKDIMNFVLQQLKDPQEFTEKLEFLYDNPDEASREEILSVDGRCFDRYSSPLKDSEGKYYGRIWFFHNITERKQMERALIEKERLSAIGELAAGVAHDFNNALQGIFGNLELALIQPIPIDVRGYLETVKKSAIDAAARINKLQRFAGKKKENALYTLVNINSVVDDAIAQSKYLWNGEIQKQGQDINIKNRCVEDLVVFGNDAELRSVLYNLLKNSVQSMPQGGDITIDTRNEGNNAYLAVTDTGIGMDQATKKRVFQPFFTTKGYEQGRGLGMSSVYTIITEHKGQVYVKRTCPGKGTSIEIMLPYVDGRLVSDKKTEPRYEGSAKVLWVDDEEIIRYIGKRILKSLGHTADIAGSGQEALELLAKNQYDLMITDIGMPRMSGWQLAERIKGMYNGMKIAILTGYGGEDVSDEQRSRYGVGYIIGKPVFKEQLEKLVGEVLQMKQNG